MGSVTTVIADVIAGIVGLLLGSALVASPYWRGVPQARVVTMILLLLAAAILVGVKLLQM